MSGIHPLKIKDIKFLEMQLAIDLLLWSVSEGRRQTRVEREYFPWKNLNLMIGNILLPVDTDYA